MPSPRKLTLPGLALVALVFAACQSSSTGATGGSTTASTTMMGTYDWACVTCDCTCAGVPGGDGSHNASFDCATLDGKACDPGDGGAADGGAPVYQGCKAGSTFLGKCPP